MCFWYMYFNVFFRVWHKFTHCKLIDMNMRLLKWACLLLQCILLKCVSLQCVWLKCISLQCVFNTSVYHTWMCLIGYWLKCVSYWLKCVSSWLKCASFVHPWEKENRARMEQVIISQIWYCSANNWTIIVCIISQVFKYCCSSESVGLHDIQSLWVLTL